MADETKSKTKKKTSEPKKASGAEKASGAKKASGVTKNHDHAHGHDHEHDDAHEHDHAHEHEVEDEASRASSDSDSSDSHSSDSDDHEHEHEVKFVEEPTFDVQYKGDCAYEVKVSIPSANESTQAETMYNELRQEAELPGFRRGKAPRKLIERKFAKAVKNDVAAKLVSGAFQKLIKDEDLDPIGYPDIDGLDEMKERESDAPIEVTIKFEVAPRVELGKYRGVEIERPFVKIDDQDVSEAISDLLSRHATFEALENGAAEEGDQVIIDFKGFVDGEPFEGGQAENFPYILGSKRFFPEFEEALRGAKPGSELKAEVTFPEKYFAEHLRGKTGTFDIKVNEVKRRTTPELNDEFAKELGHEDSEAMRAKIRESLEQSSKERSRSMAEARALEAAIAGSTFEIPKSMLERITKDYREEEIRRLMQGRVPMNQIEENMTKIDANAREAALRNIKTIVVLNEIGEAEGVDVTDEDFEKEAESMSRSMGLDVELVARYLAQSEDRGTLVDRIYRNKALAVIMENAKITDKELTRDEMDEEEGED